MNLIVDGARVSDPAWIERLQHLALPHLQACLAQGSGRQAYAITEQSLSSALDTALARALGWPEQDGRYPLAAWSAGRTGVGMARLTPCHWSLGQSHATLQDPAQLHLSIDESQALLATLASYFLEDGIELLWDRADRWLAQGDCLRDCSSASLSRVMGGAPNAFAHLTAQPAVLKRLQSEVQMLLYDHPVNDARQARGQPVVNAFHLSGSGALDHMPERTPPAIDQRLASAFYARDLTGWLEVWRQLDASILKDALEAQRMGKAVRIWWVGPADFLSMELIAPRQRPWWQIWPSKQNAASYLLASDTLADRP